MRDIVCGCCTLKMSTFPLPSSGGESASRRRSEINLTSCTWRSVGSQLGDGNPSSLSISVRSRYGRVGMMPCIAFLWLIKPLFPRHWPSRHRQHRSGFGCLQRCPKQNAVGSRFVGSVGTSRFEGAWRCGGNSFSNGQCEFRLCFLTKGFFPPGIRSLEPATQRTSFSALTCPAERSLQFAVRAGQGFDFSYATKV